MTKEIKFILNDERINIDVNPNSTLLDFIRKIKHLPGTKEVCREGDCGACSVLSGELIEGKIFYKTINSCIYPLGNCTNKHIVTIEGLNQTKLNFQQNAFAENEAAQCGFCTPGFIIATTGFLINNENYNLESALKSLDGNICRCTGYGSIKRALTNIIRNIKPQSEQNRLDFLIESNVLPIYFKDIPNDLAKLESAAKESDNSEWKNYISGGTDLFVQKAQEFTTYQDNQTGLKVHVLQGEREMVNDCRSLCEFTFSNIPPMPAGMARIRITFALDADGLLSVSAKEMHTNKEQHVEVKPSYGLTENQMYKMLYDAQFHAKQDIQERLLNEAIVQTSHLLKVVSRAIEEDRDLLKDSEYTHIKQLIKKLKNSISKKDCDNIKQLKEELSQTTQAFAEKRLERSISKQLVNSNT